MKRIISCFALSVVGSSCLVAQPFVIMPDSTNNRLVAFSPFDGSLINSNMFPLAGGTPIHAMQVGSEIWVSEQVGDRISRWSLTGSFLGAITGPIDNVRGMGFFNGIVYLTSVGTANGAPGRSVRMYDMSGTDLGFFSTPASDGFHVFPHQGDLLVSSSTANDDVHRYSLTGTSLGTFHNSTGLNFAEQMDYDVNGNVLVAGFSSNNVVRLDPNTGDIVGSFAASGARGVYQLANGNIMWTNGSGAHIYDVVSGTSTLVYAGGGRFLQYAPIPEPATLSALAAAIGILTLRKRRRAA